MSTNEPESPMESESHKPVFRDAVSEYELPSSSQSGGRWLKIVVLLVVLAVVGYGGWYAFQMERRDGNTDQTAPQAAELGKRVRANPAPAIAVTALGNAPEVSSESLKGKIILLNFWGTWCGPCQLELPQLDRLGQQLAEQFPDRAEIVAVSYPAGAEAPEAVAQTTLQYAQEHGITLPLYADPSLQLLRRYSPNGFPTTYLIDSEGFVVHVTSGYTPEDWDKLMVKLSTLLKKGEPTTSDSTEGAPIAAEVGNEVDTVTKAE